MKVRPSVAIVENNRILLMRYRYGNTDVYNLAGGNVDKGETLASTVVRELQEELGIDIELEEMLLTGDVIMPEGKEDVLHCVFRAKILNGTPVLNPQETSALEVLWQPIEELNQLDMYPNVGLELQKALNQGFEYIGKIRQEWK
ncbi:NUDIX hydrolase [Arcicella sp. LKC2W]|uniref:NUDIX hydrolase n=1 Tax=Arcicella sp. LKC2W TaxID=2984198 RepID=UPI002B217B7C|nr:NUDIX hydrolase [Arcicella sp. LKC2W]MEA5459276.1 NUDIX hydrolase [Arcicella sp. LKC2W]